MRFSAISSCEKSWVSISTVEGSLFNAAGRVGAVVGMKEDAGFQRKTEPKEDQKVEVELGIEAVLRLLERSLSTVALRR